MAKFWKESYLQKRRNEWLRSISYAEYVLNGSTYRGDIQQKKIVGDTIEVYVVIDQSVQGTNTISLIRLYDIDGEVAGERTESIIKSSTQGVLVKFEFPLKEV